MHVVRQCVRALLESNLQQGAAPVSLSAHTSPRTAALQSGIIQPAASIDRVQRGSAVQWANQCIFPSDDTLRYPSPDPWRSDSASLLAPTCHPTKPAASTSSPGRLVAQSNHPEPIHVPAPSSPRVKALRIHHGPVNDAHGRRDARKGTSFANPRAWTKTQLTTPAYRSFQTHHPRNPQ